MVDQEFDRPRGRYSFLLIFLVTVLSLVAAYAAVEFKGNPLELIEGSRIVSGAIKADHDSVLYSNRTKGAEFSRRFADYFSDRERMLTKKRNILKKALADDSRTDFRVLEKRTTFLPFASIIINGNEAHAVAFEWGVYRNALGNHAHNAPKLISTVQTGHR